MNQYVDVGNLELWVERHGRGDPLVLLHGAMGTIESCFSRLLPELARHFDVLAVELQGHGHTRDINRPMSYEAMAGDVATLLDALSIDRAHVVGYSLGGAVGLQLALDQTDAVDHLVFAGGAAFAASGMYPELRAGFETFDAHDLDGSAWHEAYCRVAPDPDAWIALVEKVNELDRRDTSFPTERLTALQAPVLLINGDADIVRPEHVIEMFRLFGGGVPGDLVGLPSARLAILPGTTHVGLLDRVDWLSTMVVEFLEADGTS
jgi:pimeloyl-ACP methyl ester carboxylesterase